MSDVFNNTIVKFKRRSLRRNYTEPERRLWSRLRNRQLLGNKFRRQYSIESFIVDFYCPEARLVIEIDGDSHYCSGIELYDNSRQKIIESHDIRVIRFTNEEIMRNINGVLDTIEKILKNKPQPNLLLKKEKEDKDL